MLSQASHYIPAGCIGIANSEIDLEPGLWIAISRQRWSMLSCINNVPPSTDGRSMGCEPHLDAGVQAALLKAPRLSYVARLLKTRWILLEFGISQVDDQLGIVRVHLLPDDVQRRTVDRSDNGLRKARRLLLQRLDYSIEAWQGQRVPVESGQVTPFDVDVSKVYDDTTLLQLFNTIPSPSPDPAGVLEPYAQDAMYRLLDSNVEGLTTRLYSYQRRSAALMLQKEVQPGQVLDPRLLHLKDMEGSSWYMDPVAGVLLLEPRHYDGVSGGILAEEMGTGKTIICLSLILASRHLPTNPPEHCRASTPPVRSKVASLADMAASCATRNAVPWKPYFEAYRSQNDCVFRQCEEALRNNQGYYYAPPPEGRKSLRYQSTVVELKKIHLSSATIIIVPNNLVAQWKQEIQKHTRGLRTLILTRKDKGPICFQDVFDLDVILFSQSRFEQLAEVTCGFSESILTSFHFKRCIVDEGHKLGNSKIGSKSNLLLGIEALRFSSRWIVTGTPSHGLFGVDGSSMDQASPRGSGGLPPSTLANGLNATSTQMEKKDLQRIGAIAALYLRARPWANTVAETEDSLADWSTYLMLPRHNPKSRGRCDCLRSTLDTLIVRHRLAEVNDLLPPVDDRVVVLDGSYQDQLSLNLFSMMIVFNSVQSQRTDMDYFFHHRQRRALLQIVHNLKQASFFGGSFYDAAEIAKAVRTAEEFSRDAKVPISPEDKILLQGAIDFGHLAMRNKLKDLGNRFHEMALCVSGFPGGAGRAWSLSGDSDCDGAEDTVCTSTSMLLAMQKLIYNTAERQDEMNSLLNGGLVREGRLERQRLLAAEASARKTSPKEDGGDTLAGNTKLGDDKLRKSRHHGINGIESIKSINAESLSGPLESTMITSTVSVKLKYLVDNIVKYQDDEKIIVFYEHDNMAWYLASMLDVLQIRYLIYAKALTVERRVQYVNTFHHDPHFNVLLMDLSQAAFGLDMREASRIYFINPVLNPQVEAQAIGRVRRISQKKPVSVETLVLKNSIDEVILERKQHMTQAEHRHAKSILDIRPIFNWIKNARVCRMRESSDDFRSQMVDFQTAQPVFGRGFGRTPHPDDGIILSEDHGLSKTGINGEPAALSARSGLKRAHDGQPAANGQNPVPLEAQETSPRPARRVRFA